MSQSFYDRSSRDDGRMRLDVLLVRRDLAPTRSQAEQLIEFGFVAVDGKIVMQPGKPVSLDAKIRLIRKNAYVSRAGMKLESVAQKLHLKFQGKTVLDVGSSTGGFTDYSLQHGAKKVIAVDVGTNQMHPKLREDPRVSLHEQTDIREFDTSTTYMKNLLEGGIDIVVIDVSFISLRNVLPSINKLKTKSTVIVAMCKPQFEAGRAQISKGVVKNNAIRRDILQDFETWLTDSKFVIVDKADSEVTGEKGNVERFYLLK